MTESLKRCVSCELHKPRAAFYASIKNKDGLQARCKQCANSPYVAKPGTIRMPRSQHALREALAQPKSPRQLPMTRAECEFGPRPCPYVSCKHHLYLDASPATGTIKLNFPDLEPDELVVSCVLDVAESGGLRLEDVANSMNVTRERVRQLEASALRKLELSGLLDQWKDGAA